MRPGKDSGTKLTSSLESLLFICYKFMISFVETVATTFWTLNFIFGLILFNAPTLCIFLISLMLESSHYFSDLAPVTITFPLENIIKVALGSVFQRIKPLNLALLYRELFHFDARSPNLRF